MIREFEGIVLSEVAYGETSKIINVLTEEYGLIGIMAKGAKGMKSKLRSGTEKFTYAVFNVRYNEGKLSTLIGVDILNSLINIKSDIIKISYLMYIGELVIQTARQTTSIGLFKIFKDTMLKMEEGLNPKILTNILEVKVLDFLGVGLDLDKCVKCASKTDIITISGEEGGYICKTCHTNEIIYDEKTIKMIRAYYYIEISSIKELKISELVINNIDMILTDYYDRYTGLYLKSKEFLKEIVS